MKTTLISKTITGCIAVFIIGLCLWNMFNPWLCLDLSDNLNMQINKLGFVLGLVILFTLGVSDIEYESDYTRSINELKNANNLIFSMKGNIAKMSKNIKDKNKTIKHLQTTAKNSNITYDFTN